VACEGGEEENGEKRGECAMKKGEHGNDEEVQRRQNCGVDTVETPREGEERSG